MPDIRSRLLVVDDDPSLRTSFSLVFRQLGYDVRSAEDGFSALSEMRNQVPDVLLCDLDLPGMSGFEFLPVVRRRFPAIRVIAMSGAFSSRNLPQGVPADGFYQKGSGMDLLLKALADASQTKVLIRKEAPIWMKQNGYDSSGEDYITLVCPECLRVFPHALGDSTCPISAADCIHCGVSIQYAIAAALCA